jgi:CheY-like chemotaxis protein
VNPLEFLGEFQAEASEKLEVIAAELLRLEKNAADLQPVREMFLAAHTIKGGAAMLRLTDVEALAHALEDLLSSFRDRDRTLDSATADLLFQSIDQLRNLISVASAAAIGAEADPQMAAFAERLRAAASGAPVEAIKPPAASSAPPVMSVAPPAAAPSLAAPRALVVDDSATVRALHALLLEQAGYAVECCDDGRAGLDRALQTPFALVVSGLQTRGLDGFQLARALRAQPAYQAVPIILMSADADAALAQRARAAGASMLLRKSAPHDERLTAALASLTAASAA